MNIISHQHFTSDIYFFKAFTKKIFAGIYTLTATCELFS